MYHKDTPQVKPNLTYIIFFQESGHGCIFSRGYTIFMIIDAHNHLGGPDKGDGKSQSPDEIIAVMDKAGIDRAVVFPFNEAEPGVSFSRPNEYIAHAVYRHPDRLTGFCRLDPNFGGQAVKELERCVKELGLSGIKLHPSSQGFALDHPALHDILTAAQELRLPVVFDTGKAMSPPSGIAALALKFPGLTFIMAHMNLYDESISAAKAASNIYIQTTGYFNIKRLGNAFRELGADRFMAGSDSPYLRMERELEKVSSIDDLTKSERGSILGGNISRVLGL